MRKITFLVSFICLGILTIAFGQKASIELTFTATSNTQSVILDSVYVENLTQGGDTTIVAPNSSLMIEYVGIDDVSTENHTMTLSQNYPNPIRQQSNINLFLPEKDDITIRIHNLIGQEVTSFEGKLSNGNHSFTFYPGNEDTYLLTVLGGYGSQSIKMVNIKRKGNKQCKIVYSGNSNNANVFKSLQSTMGFVFSYGDELRYIGYAKTTEQISGADVIEDAPQMDESYEFEISAGMPCQKEPYFIYEDQQYNTVQIGTQCWMAQNMNVGTFIYDTVQTDNDTIEKYCYNNVEDSCDIYGGMYRWDEMMGYTTLQGSQGICPAGWHIPTSDEWMILTDFCGGMAVAGGVLKEEGTVHWDSPNTGATNEYGFTALPGGSHLNNTFYDLGNRGISWSSTEYSNSSAWTRGLWYDTTLISVGANSKTYSFMIRCLKDFLNNQPPSQPSNPIPEDGTMDISINTLLSWTCSDPEGDDLLYNVYLGTDPNPPLMAENLIDPGYNPILEYETTYYWNVVAFDVWGDSAVSNIWNFTTETNSGNDPCLGDTLLIYEGQTYTIVGIGEQCWMAENLNVGTFIYDTVQTDNDTIEKYCYNIVEDSCDIYGGMYRWDEMMGYTTLQGSQGICPAGWHIPTNEEWTALTDFCGGIDVAGGKLKETGTEHWDYPNTGATNEYGFTALPGGSTFNGTYNNLGDRGIFWSSTEEGSNAHTRAAWYDNTTITEGTPSQNYGFSVRCVKD